MKVCTRYNAKGLMVEREVMQVSTPQRYFLRALAI